MLSLYQTNEQGQQWLKQRLGIHATADRNPTVPIDIALANSVSLSCGKVMSLLEYPLKGTIYYFDAGCYRNTSEVLPMLARWIHDFVQRHPLQICLIDEQNSEPHDLSWKNVVNQEFSDAVLYCDDSIFYRISPQNNDINYIKELLRLTFSWFFCCAFIKSDNIVRTCKPQHNVSLADLQEATTNTMGLAVDAYDLEGLVIWTPKIDNITIENPF